MENTVRIIFKLFRIIQKEPLAALHLCIACLKGCYSILYFRLRHRSVRIRFPFFVYEKVRIKGPGSVLIDKFCSVYPNIFHGLSIVTLSREAHVRIGSHCSLGGLTIRCRKTVEIGERALSAYSLVQDCLFNEEERVRSRVTLPDSGRSGEISIAPNVWLGGESCVLLGSIIERDSVISAGTVIYNARVPEFHLASGNPVLRSLPISRILGMRG
jgi:acetyltransferase-like isoleucine patch superfamily enzyme